MPTPKPPSPGGTNDSGSFSDVEVTESNVKILVPPSGQSTVITIVTSDVPLPQRPDVPEEYDRPDDRDQAFFAQRLSTPVVPPEPSPSPQAPSPPLPHGFRASLVGEYRGRMLDHLARTSPASLAVTPAPRTSARVQGVKFGSPAKSGQPNWVSIGPSASMNGLFPARTPVGGRVRGIAVSSDGQRVYVASANGGLWRSDDAGATFYPLMNAFDLSPTTNKSDSLACGAVAIDPDRPDRVYVGSGEAVGEGDMYFGVGVVASEDGGMNFTTETMRGVSGSGFYAMAVDPLDSRLAFGAADQGLFRRQSRNQDVPGLPKDKPQSYLLSFNTNTGAPTIGYWSGDGTRTTGVWAPGAGTWHASTKTFSFSLNNAPWFVRYQSNTGDIWTYSIPPDATPVQGWHPAAWTANLLLMCFTMGSTSYVVRYESAMGANTMLLRFASDGSAADAWNAARDWDNPWTALVPFTLYGVPHFLKYDAAVGNDTVLCRWNADLTVTDVATLAVIPPAANLVPVEVEGEPYLLVYLAANGQTTLYRWSVAGALTLVWQRIALPANATSITPFTFGGEPRLLVYVAGVTSVYGWGPGPTPVLLWTEGWSANLTFMPFLMGYEWVYDSKRFSPPPTGTSAAPGKPRATSVAVARGGAQTVYFAAFWGRGQVYRSLDRGDHWELLGELPLNQGRVAIGVQPSNPNVVYALTETGDVYRYQIDGGPGLDRWNRIAGAPPANLLVGSAGGYDLAIAVDPDDIDRIYLGASSVFSQANQDKGWGAALYRCEVSLAWTDASPAPIPAFSMVYSYIGASVHADVHTLTFTPGQSNALWVGCDGGVFYTSRADDTRAAGTDMLFQSMNNGISTMMVNGLGQQGTDRPYDAIVMNANQDNGDQRYTGAEAWSQVGDLGDSGRVVYRHNAALANPVKDLLVTYTNASLWRSFDAGATFPKNVSMTLAQGEPSQFYAPLVVPTGVELVVFGTVRPWITLDFGKNWYSIPLNNYANAPAGDIVNWPYTITALAVSADARNIYAGFADGKIYQYVSVTGGWPWAAGVRVDAGNLLTLTGADVYPNDNPIPITSIVINPGNANEILVTLGGNLSAKNDGWQRVWYLTGGNWTARSGGNAGASTQLMNVQHNTLVADPASLDRLYVGADIGVWTSANRGQDWTPFGEGLPEAPVLDLAIFPPKNITDAAGNNVSNFTKLLRAATHGRGVYERALVIANMPVRNNNPVLLYVRANLLDRGLYDVQTGIPNPIADGNVTYYDGVDIKVVAPAPGSTVFPSKASITFTEFAALTDQSGALKVNRPARVYAQVHNRGPWPGTQVKVTFAFRASIAGALPTAVGDLPAGYVATVQGGGLVSGDNWSTISVAAIDALYTGLPLVVSADIPAALLANAVNYCVLILITSAEDQFNPPNAGAGNRNVVYLVKAEPKAAMKYLVVTN